MRSERQALAEPADELNGMMDSPDEDNPPDAIYEQLRERW